MILHVVLDVTPYLCHHKFVIQMLILNNIPSLVVQMLTSNFLNYFEILSHIMNTTS